MPAGYRELQAVLYHADDSYFPIRYKLQQDKSFSARTSFGRRRFLHTLFRAELHYIYLEIYLIAD